MFNRCLRKYKISCCKHRRFIVHFLEQYRNTIRVCSICVTLVSVVSILMDYKTINNHEIYYTVFVDVLSDWQTLIAGVLALLGAWITVSTMRKQEADRIYRRSLAYRAKLHMSLKTLENYTDDIIIKIVLGEEVSDLEMPEKALTTLGEMIEYVDDQSAQYLSQFLSKYQIMMSRVLDGTLREEHLKDVFIVQGFLSPAWDYARDVEIIVLPKELDIYYVQNRFNLSKLGDEKQDIWKRYPIDSNELSSLNTLGLQIYRAVCFLKRKKNIKWNAKR